jgi:hypothetical protein
MQAVHLRPGEMIQFSTIPVPESIRAELIEDGAEIIEDVTFPGIPERGGHICVSVDDPKRFQVFDTREEARAQGFEPLEVPYGLKSSEKQWRSFLKGSKEMKAIASQTDETDTDEAWDSIMANLRRPDYP